MMLEMHEPTRLVPGPVTAQTGIVPLRGNNNLDVIRHDGRVWLAWRTAPTHFASARPRIEVVSAPELSGPWRAETTFSTGADLRECRFVEWRGRLHLYVLELGTNAFAFQPRRTHLLRHDGERFVDPQIVWESPTVPWRFRVVDGNLRAFVYTGADKIYTPIPEPTTVEVWSSDDGIDWRPDPGPIHRGGCEFDAVELDDGTLLGVTRVEGPTFWGSTVTRGRLGEPPEAWRAVDDPRKFDSPHVFRHGERILMVARRHLRHEGRFDLGWTRPRPAIRTRLYDVVYSATRKRSALWEIDPETLNVIWLNDLPSRGDTSFGAVLSGDDDAFVVVDYTSPLDGPDTSWIRGQLGPTQIISTQVTMR